MNIDEIKKTIIDLENEKYYKHAVEISPNSINSILSELSGEEVNIMEDPNGCDMDWSFSFVFGDYNFDAWGSAFDGNFLIKKEE